MWQSQMSQIGNAQGMWMTSCSELMGWGFWDLKKKTGSWDSKLEEGSRFLIWARPDQGSTGCPRVGWVSELRADDVLTVSIVRNCVSLSPHVGKPSNSKRWIKSFVPEPISSVFGFLYAYEHYTRKNITNILWTYVHYSYTYLGRIFGPIYYNFIYIISLRHFQVFR